MSISSFCIKYGDRSSRKIYICPSHGCNLSESHSRVEADSCHSMCLGTAVFEFVKQFCSFIGSEVARSSVIDSGHCYSGERIYSVPMSPLNGFIDDSSCLGKDMFNRLWAEFYRQIILEGLKNVRGYLIQSKVAKDVFNVILMAGDIVDFRFAFGQMSFTIILPCFFIGNVVDDLDCSVLNFLQTLTAGVTGHDSRITFTLPAYFFPDFFAVFEFVGYLIANIRFPSEPTSVRFSIINSDISCLNPLHFLLPRCYPKSYFATQMLPLRADSVNIVFENKSIILMNRVDINLSIMNETVAKTASGAEGRRFESCIAHQILKAHPVRRVGFCLWCTRETSIKAAKSKLEAFQRGKQSLSVSLPGRPELRAECRLSLSGFRDGVNGLWSVTRAVHKLGSGGYVTSVEGERV